MNFLKVSDAAEILNLLISLIGKNIIFKIFLYHSEKDDGTGIGTAKGQSRSGQKYVRQSREKNAAGQQMSVQFKKILTRSFKRKVK